MSDSTAVVVPRRNRDEASPAAPLDPYVTILVRWIATHEGGAHPNALPKQAASALEWPVPFAEAIVTAARARRLLTLEQITPRGSYRTALSSRGRTWLRHVDEAHPNDTRVQHDH